jgi:hypothetical protein
MPSSPIPLLTWLATLPPPPADHVRLYRIQTARPVALPPWVVAEHHADGTALARGRWFTRDPAALAFYAQEWDHPELVTLDLSPVEAMACRLDQLPAVLADGTHPRSFSRDAETEHFVDATQLHRVQRHGWLPTPLGRRRRPRS